MSEKLRIFLSCVFSEFKDQRQELKKFLEEDLCLDVYISENDEKPQKSSEQKLIDELKKSHIFILLLGSQHGSKHSQKDISITNWEFETAVKNLQMEWFAFYKKDAKFEGGQKKFRDEVFNFVEGRDTLPFSNTNELKQKIKEHLLRLMSGCTIIMLPTLSDKKKRGKLFVKVHPHKTTGPRAGIERAGNGVKLDMQIKFYNDDVEHDYLVDNIRLFVWGKSYRGTSPSISLPTPIQRKSHNVFTIKFYDVIPPSNDNSEAKEMSEELIAEIKKLNASGTTNYLSVDFDIV